MIHDLRDVVTVTLAKRMASPFLSSFFFAWLIVNYDIVLMVFSSSAWNVKVLYINQAYEVFNDYYHRIFFPILISMFYVMIWPFIDMKLYRISKNWSKRFKELQKLIEDETPLTREEEKKIKEQSREMQDNYREEIYKKDIRISELENRIQSFVTEIAELREKMSLSEQEKEKEKLNSKSEYSQEIHRVETLASEFPMEENNESDSELLGQKGATLNELKENLNTNDSGKDNDFELVSDDWRFAYSFLIDPSIIRKASVHGRKLNEVSSVKFSKKEMPEEIWLLFHNVHYESASHEIPSEGFLIGVGHKNTFKEQWRISVDPTEISSIDILRLWAADYLHDPRNENMVSAMKK